jgi:hypothetical protein
VPGAITIVAAAMVALAGCQRPADSAPPPSYLPRVAERLGRPYDGQRVLRVKDRRLVLASGEGCLPGEPACAAALKELEGQPLALEIEQELLLADLSVALATLSSALGPRDFPCLLVADATQRRCLPFRPLSGEEFGAWLDAEKPFGKIRVVMRSDGMELVTDRGKVPGPDRFGPSIPTEIGRPDFDTLLRTLSRMKSRFPDEEEAVLAASARTTLGHAAQVLAALSGEDASRFGKTYLVYP